LSIKSRIILYHKNQDKQKLIAQVLAHKSVARLNVSPTLHKALLTITK